MEENFKLKDGQNIKFAQNAYWLFENDKPINGPFCVACYHRYKQLVPLIHISETAYRCDLCNNGKVTYVEEE